jgi:hypothetical protein
MVPRLSLPIRFVRWASKSLVGHLVFFGGAFAIGESLFFCTQNYMDGTLTVAWAIWIVSASIVLGALGAGAVWYTMTLPRLKRRGQR